MLAPLTPARPAHKSLALAAAALLFACAISCAAQQAEQSLGEIARRNKAQAKRKAGQTMTNENVPEKLTLQDFPSLGARFALPPGWEDLTEHLGGLRSTCPNQPTPPSDPRFSTMYPDSCGLFLAAERMPADSKRPPREMVEWVRDALLRITVREVTPWRSFTIGDMPAGEHTIETGKPGKIQRLRFALVMDVPRNTLLFLSVIAKPEHFEAVSPALDTILKTLVVTKM